MTDISMLVTMWETAKEYIPAKDRQTAADHVVAELIDIGIDDEDLKELAVDKPMLNAIKEHIDVSQVNDEDDED